MKKLLLVLLLCSPVVAAQVVHPTIVECRQQSSDPYYKAGYQAGIGGREFHPNPYWNEYRQQQYRNGYTDGSRDRR